MTICVRSIFLQRWSDRAIFLRIVHMSNSRNLSGDEVILRTAQLQMTGRMPIESSSIRVYQSFDSLPPSYGDFFAECGRSNYHLSGEWFERLFRTCAQSSDNLRIYGYEEHGAPAGAILAWHKTKSSGFLSGRTLSGLSNWYSKVVGRLYNSGLGAILLATIISL